MKKIVHIVLFLFVVFPVSAELLCVQTLNTYGVFYSDNLEQRYQQTQLFLEENPCDIILLQEVIEQEYMTRLTRMSQGFNFETAYFGSFSRLANKNSGLMSIVNGQIHNTDILFFPRNVYEDEMIAVIYDAMSVLDKGIGAVHFTPVAHRQPILVFNLHLHHLSQRRRVGQLLLWLKGILDRPLAQPAIIAAGDFNFEPDSLEFDMVRSLLRLQDPYEYTYQEHQCTHLCEGSAYELFRFFLGEGVRDYVFFRNSATLSMHPWNVEVSPKKYNGVDLSDHYGVRATFNVVERKSAASFLLSVRVKEFQETLSRVEDFIKTQTSEENSFEMDMITLFRKQLEDSSSRLIQYLSY